MPVSSELQEKLKNSKVAITEKVQRILEDYALFPMTIKKMSAKYSMSPNRMRTILKDSDVAKAIDEIREENFGAAAERFRLLADRAVTILENALNRGDADAKIALNVLIGIGIANAKISVIPLHVEIINPVIVDKNN